MNGFGWLRRLRDNEKGNALLLGAAALPLLLGAAGLAVDTIQLGVWKRQLQRAADSSAIAGVYAMTQGFSTNTQISDAVAADLAQNVYPTLSQTQTVTPGPFQTFPRAVQVGLVSSRRLPFISLFTGREHPITANAAAALVSDGRFCVLSLYKGTAVGVDVGGNAAINLGCGIASNSRSATAVTADGSSELTASPIMAVGGINGAGSNFATGTVLQPHSAEQLDPFRDILPGSPSVPCTELTGNPQATRTESETTVSETNEVVGTNYDQLCFSSINFDGRWDLGDNNGRPRVVYVYGGDLNFGSQAHVTCTGCTFVMTGPGGAAGNFITNGHPRLEITAPTSGTFRNIAIFRDRLAAATNITVNGGTGGFIEGALYFPTSNVQVNGNAGFNVRCFQLIGQLLEFRGSAALTNTCDRTTDNSGFQLQYVRLVA